MIQNFRNEPSGSDPRATRVGQLRLRDDPYLRTIATLPDFLLGDYLENTIRQTPAPILEHALVGPLLKGSGSAPFRFESVRITVASRSCGVDEIHTRFDFVLTGYLPGNHGQTRTISGDGTAIFFTNVRVGFDVNTAKMNDDIDDSAGAPDSDSPQP